MRIILGSIGVFMIAAGAWIIYTFVKEKKG